MFLLEKIIKPIKKNTFDILAWNIISLVIKFGRKKAERNFNIQTKNQSVLFNTQYHWYHSWVDYSMAAALKYRGFNVKMIICDGLPYCEQETVSVKRPSCSSCYKGTKKKVDLFGLSSVKISELITKEKIIEIGELSKKNNIDNLKIYKKLKVNIGEMALRNLTHFYKGVVEIFGDREVVFRKCIESALIICEANNNLFKSNRFDKVIGPNGKFIQSGIALELSELYKIDYYTWDVFNQGGAIFSKNDIAHDQKIDSVWPSIKIDSINKLQINKVNEFYGLQSKSLNTPFKYYDKNVVNDFSKISAELSLNKNSRLITLFTNVEWDSTAMGQNLAYFDMFDWVSSIIDFVIDKKNIDLIIRAHPGESKVPKHLKTNSKICDRILVKYENLPAHIKLIGPKSNLSSYALSKLSDIAMVYTSTLGLEFALMGIKPWVAATPYYSGKGFTLDIKSHEHFKDLFLDSKLVNKVSKKELENARILAYAVRFRRVFNYPIFDHNGKFKLFDYQILLNSDADNTIQNICDFIEDKRNYLDLGSNINS